MHFDKKVHHKSSAGFIGGGGYHNYWTGTRYYKIRVANTNVTFLTTNHKADITEVYAYNMLDGNGNALPFAIIATRKVNKYIMYILRSSTNNKP